MYLLPSISFLTHHIMHLHLTNMMSFIYPIFFLKQSWIFRNDKEIHIAIVPDLSLWIIPIMYFFMQPFSTFNFQRCSPQWWWISLSYKRKIFSYPIWWLWYHLDNIYYKTWHYKTQHSMYKIVMNLPSKKTMYLHWYLSTCISAMLYFMLLIYPWLILKHKATRHFW